MQHTLGKLRINDMPLPARGHIEINGDKVRLIMKDLRRGKHYTMSDSMASDAQRIVDCVNGCIGIENPGAIMEAVEALKLADGIASTLMDELVGIKATNWSIVNGGLVRIGNALKNIQKE